VDVNKHPIFFLKDVKYSELQALIQYMYRGEVNIAQEDLDSLLQVAQSLKIRGLADVEASNNSISSDTIILPDHGNANRHKPPPPPTVQHLLPPPAPIPAPSTSNLHFTRSFQPPSHSYGPPNLNSKVSSPILASAPSGAPPPGKKIRIDTTKLSSPHVKVQNQTQLIDPLLTVRPIPAPVSPQLFDPLHLPSTSSSSHYESAAHAHNREYGDDGMVEQPEAYETEGVS